MAIATVNPENEKSELITPGEYGKDTPAILTKVYYGANRFAPDKRVLSLTVSVNDQSLGKRLTRTIDVPDWDTGSKVPKFLRQLGVSNDEMASGFDTDKLHDTQVLVNIGVREYKRSDDPEGAKTGRQNTIVDIRRIAD